MHSVAGVAGLLGQAGKPEKTLSSHQPDIPRWLFSFRKKKEEFGGESSRLADQKKDFEIDPDTYRLPFIFLDRGT